MVGLEIKADCALLRSLAVKKTCRNQGLATDLVQRIEKYTRSLSLKRLYLLTMTAEDFFMKRGFQRTQRKSAPAGIQATAEFKDLCPVSAAFMTKQL